MTIFQTFLLGWEVFRNVIYQIFKIFFKSVYSFFIEKKIDSFYLWRHMFWSPFCLVSSIFFLIFQSPFDFTIVFSFFSFFSLQNYLWLKFARHFLHICLVSHSLLFLQSFHENTTIYCFFFLYGRCQRFYG